MSYTGVAADPVIFPCSQRFSGHTRLCCGGWEIPDRCLPDLCDCSLWINLDLRFRSLPFPAFSLSTAAHRREQRAQVWAGGGQGYRNGCMESPERVEVPAAFEDVDVDVLVQLIGSQRVLWSASSAAYTDLGFIEADMMERLMAINDQIPLSP